MTMPTHLSPDEAVSVVQSGQRIFVQGSAATPLVLLHALSRQAHRLQKVEVVCMSVLGDIAIQHPDHRDAFYFRALFVSEPIREAVNQGRGDYIPVFLSEAHLLFEWNILPLDVAFIHVSPPDAHGFCSLGTSVDVARAAVKYAKHVIAQVNPHMPRTHGDGLINLRDIDTLVDVDVPLPEIDYAQDIGKVEADIAQHVAALIPDGATLQMGIGTLPDAVLAALHHHKDLGVHTEMLSNGIIDLMEKGVINNARKAKHRFRTATSFALGSRRLYDFLDDNPAFVFLNASYINDPQIIRANPKVMAINSALEIDLTGQVCADSIGTRQYSGVGGQMDFMRGAIKSEGGKAILAMASTTSKGQSKIVPFLREGAGVVTTRAHVHHVVTEHGAVDLFGKSLKQRALALRDLADEAHREVLDRAIFERFG